MTHVSEGTLQAFLDGELAAGERAGVMRHLSSCGDCAAELETLRSAALELSGALGWLDRAAPTDAAHAAIRVAAAAPATLAFTPRIGLAAPRRAMAGTRRALVRAAMLVLGLAAAASAAIPGSPVRDWLTGTWQRLAGDAPAAAPDTGSDVPAAAPAANGSPAGARAGGLANILPLNGEIRIILESPAPGSRVRVRLVDAGTAAVYTFGAAADARFETGSGRVTVRNITGGEVRIDLPRSLSTALVTAGGRALAVKDADSLRAVTPAVESSTGELVFRAGF